MSHNPLNAGSPHPASTNSPHGIVTSVQEKHEKHPSKAGASWKANEQQVLPHNRFWIVFPGLMCCIFLAALDQVRSQSCLFSAVRRFTFQQTIVATALPTIVERLGQGQNYSWVGRYPFFVSLASPQINPDLFSQLLPPCRQRARPIVRKVI
jgi:hypothetical protein